MLTLRFFAIEHLQKTSYTASLKNVPGSRCSAFGRKYYHFFFQIKRYKCSYWKKYT